MHNMEQQYTLTVNKENPQTGATESHTYTANSPEEMSYLLKLAGIEPKDAVVTSVPVQQPEAQPSDSMLPVSDFEDMAHEDPEPEPEFDEYEVPVVHPCGCEDKCGCGEQTPELPYDNDTFEPEANMNDWQARSFETLVNTPSDQWPRLVEQFVSELQSKGLTKEEAEEKVLKLMDMDIVEGYDYGHHDYGHKDYMDGQHIARIRGSTIDKAKWNRMDQRYVQARYGDNPLDPRGMVEGKDFFAMYHEFLESLKDKDDG